MANLLLNSDGQPINDDWADRPRHGVESLPNNAQGWILELANDFDADSLELAQLNGCVGIELSFPSFVDGRAYTQASALRLAGFTGPLRAIGEVLIDQILLMRRCGIDQFLLAEGLSQDAAQRALKQFRVAAQPARNDAGLTTRRAPAPATTSL